MCRVDDPKLNVTITMREKFEGLKKGTRKTRGGERERVGMWSMFGRIQRG